jgi:nitrite reductase (NO-forming)
MGRIEIATARTPPAQLGRPLVSDHNLSARIWATGALLSVLMSPWTGLGWWLPLHMALLGAASQAIVGGQLMFSATLGLSRGPGRGGVLTQLTLLNAAAILVIGGRLIGESAVLATGASLFVPVIAWVTWQVHLMWRNSVNRRFSITGTFYRLAGTSLLFGASIGGALGIGAFNDGSSYIAHRGVHMILNIFGWAGMTIVGTAITLLPTILHVRSPALRVVRPTPWLMAGGLLLVSTGATTNLEWLAGTGMALYVAGFALFALYLKAVLAIPSRREIPTAAFHLVAAMAWALVTAVAIAITMARGDSAATRDFIVVGGALGFAFQALMGAWSFLLPSTRPPVPQQRRVELIAMELGGRSQVLTYNVGLVLALLGLRLDTQVSLLGTWAAWTAAAWVLTKSWTFPILSGLPAVERRSARWWADPEKTTSSGRLDPNHRLTHDEPPIPNRKEHR